MEEYYFLFVIGLVWTLFASIQDLKTREVSNWLNFSLIGIGLSYRAFFSIVNKDFNFFFLGIAGFFVFFVFAYILYYARAFAGGDAKLLMGYGALMPFANFGEILPLSLLFLLLLFFIGSIYSLVYSGIIVSKNKKFFNKDFAKGIRKNKILLTVCGVLFLGFLIYGFISQVTLFISVLFLLPFIWVYAKSLDKCMIKLIPSSKLTEGDWILGNIKVARGKVVYKTVHGLSLKDIRLLRKYKRKILVKEGIPFVPVFMISLIIMVFVYLTSGLSLLSLFSSLF